MTCHHTNRHESKALNGGTGWAWRALWVIGLWSLLTSSTTRGIDLQVVLDQVVAQATNRNVIVRPQALVPVPGHNAIYDPYKINTGTNTSFWISNVLSGTYLFEVQAPPSMTTFMVYVDPTNAVQYGGSNAVASAKATWPPGSVAWAASASDLRYAKAGTVGANADVTIRVFTNGTVVAPWGEVDTTGTTTSGIQEAINALTEESDVFHPAGGKIVLGSAAPYYTTSTILYSNYWCGSLEIEGQGLMAGGIVYRGTVPAPVIKVVSKSSQATVSDPVCPMALHLHDMFIGSVTNASTNVIELFDFARAEIDHCWIGHWTAMTNNNQFFGNTNVVGFSTCTFGFGVSNTALVGISVRGVSDMLEIHGNSFIGLAASAHLGSDHMRVWNNFSSFVGISNAVPNTSPYSLGAAFVIQPDMSHNDLYLRDNFFYNCQAGYFIFATNGTGSYNYNTASSWNDTYEATPTNVLLTANVRMKQYDPAFLRESANNNAIVSTYPSYAVQNGRIESDRVQVITTRTNRLNISGSEFVLANGRAAITNTAPTATNSFYVYSCGITAANGWYTNPITGPDGPGVGELVYTNGTTGYYLLFDPQHNIITSGGNIGIFNNADVQEYVWTESVDDPLIWQPWPLGGANHGTAPVGQLQPVLSGAETVVAASRGAFGGGIVDGEKLRVNGNASISGNVTNGSSSQIILSGGSKITFTGATSPFITNDNGALTLNSSSSTVTIGGGETLVSGGSLGVPNVTASRVLLTGSTASRLLTAAAASGSVPMNADGSATTLSQILTITPSLQLVTNGFTFNLIGSGGWTNTGSAGLTYNASKTPTNSTFAPDFRLGSAETNIGAAFTLSLPINVDSTKTFAQTTIFIIRTNGSGSSPFALTSPTGVSGTGTAYVTNTTVVTVYAYGNEFTNYNYNPIK